MCGKLGSLVEDFSANGKVSLNWLSHPRGQVQLIFKGPRIKTENIIVEAPGDGIERYFPPMAVLQEKSESAKLIDTKRASKKQLHTIKVLRVQQGDLLVTRSGTIGRVAYATKRLVGAVVSDDMIRIRIKDETIRYYVYAYLQSFAGHNQMFKNEYGSVQQHLEAKHIAGILISIPPKWGDVKHITEPTKAAIESRESLEERLLESTHETQDLLMRLINGNGKASTQVH